MRIREKLEQGTVLKVVRSESNEERGGRVGSVSVKFRVVKQWPHWVEVENGCGNRSGITNAELYQNGLVTPI